jgi:O-antigen ligase
MTSVKLILDKISSALRGHFFYHLKDGVFAPLALAALFMPITINPLYSFFPYDSIKFGIFYFFVGLSTILFFRGQTAIKTVPGALFFLCAFLAIATIASLTSSGFFISLVGAPVRWIGLIFFFALSVFILGLSSTLNPSRERFLVKILIATGLLNSILVILQTFGIGYYENIGTFNYLYRAPALLGNPNFVAIFVLVSSMLGISSLIQAAGFKSKVFYSLTIFFNFWAMVLLASRGALFGLGLALSVFIALVFIRKGMSIKKILLPVISLVLLAALFFIFGNVIRPNAFTEALTQSDISSYNRLFALEAAVKAMLDKPLTGFGLANFEEIQRLYINAPSILNVFDDPHNLYLYLGSTGGIGLLLAFLGLNFYALISSFSRFRSNQDQLAAAIFAGLTGFLVSASFNPMDESLWMLWALLVAMGTYYNSKPFGMPSRRARALIVIGIFFAAYGIYFFTIDIVALKSINSYFEKDYTKSKSYAQAIRQPISPFLIYSELMRVKSRIDLNEDPQSIALDLESLGRGYGNDDCVIFTRGIQFFRLYLKTNEQRYFDRAIYYMEKGLGYYPYYGGLENRIAYMYYVKGDYGKAKAHIFAQLTTSRSDMATWLILANIYNSQGDEKMVKATLTSASNSGIIDSSQLDLFSFLLKQADPKERLEGFNFDSFLKSTIDPEYILLFPLPY